MPLARAQRIRLARVLAWSRSNGWVHDVYPNTWRSTDGQTHIRFDSLEEELVVDRLNSGQNLIPTYRVALVPVDSPDLALRVLAALGHIPTSLGFGDGLHADLTADDEARATYRSLMAGGHAYMSTYCQHALHDDCKLACKCCGAPCLCSGCLHAPSKPMPAASDEDTFDGSDAFDGPASFVDAGQALADWTDGLINPEHAAELLSRLARAGLIISVAYHDETTGDGQPGEAALMADVASIIDGTDR